MTNYGKVQHKITLGDDGELHQRLVNPAYTQDAIFCVHCSTANLPDARFCNQCGRSLIEQQTDTPYSQNGDWAKRKHDEAQKPRMAMYDPSRYDLKEKPSDARYIAVFIIYALVFAGPKLLEVMATIVRFVNTHPTECILALVSIALIGGTYVSVKMWKS